MIEDPIKAAYRHNNVICSCSRREGRGKLGGVQHTGPSLRCHCEDRLERDLGLRLWLRVRSDSGLHYRGIDNRGIRCLYVARVLDALYRGDHRFARTFRRNIQSLQAGAQHDDVGGCGGRLNHG